MAMQKLTPEKWHLFNKDGKLFEALIGDLLQTKFPEAQFSQTKPSWDGNRDHTGTITLLNQEEAHIWAECKYKSKKLPIHDVSMTLLLAYIEAVHQILIFSYSPINKNFRAHIARYQDRTKTPVHIYDDLSLEEFIFDHWKHLSIEKQKKYFPDLFNKLIKLEHVGSIACEYKLSKEHQREDGCIVLQLNDYLEVELFLHNTYKDKQSISVAMDLSSSRLSFSVSEAGQDGFLSGNYQKQITIPPNTSRLLKFSLHLREAVKKIILPHVTIMINNEPKKLYIKESVTYRWLADIKLIGKNHKKFIETGKTLLNIKNSINFMVLWGESGIGKSRLLTEMKILAKHKHRAACYIDTDKTLLTAELFVHQLIASIEKFPLVHTIQEDSFSAIFAESDDTSYRKKAFQILYDKKYDISNNKAEIAKLIITLLENNNTILLLDNVQNYDETSLEILNYMIYYSEQSLGFALVVLSFNTQRLHKGTFADESFNRLKVLCSQKPNRFYIHELCGLQYNESIEYVKQCLQFETPKTKEIIPYDLSIKKIVDVCKGNPYYLRNYLLYLEQQDIIRRTELSSFYIHNIENFQQALNTIPDNIEVLLRAREQEFIQNLKKRSQEDLDQYITFASLLSLVKHFPTQLVTKIIGNKELIKEIKNLGFVIESSSKVTFAHQFFELYYEAAYPIDSIPRDILENFITAIQSTYFSQELFCPIFIAKFMLAILDNDDFRKMQNSIISRNVAPVYSDLVFKSFNHLIKYKHFSIKHSDIVLVYDVIAMMSAGRVGIEKSLFYFDEFTQRYINEPEKFLDSLPRARAIMREHICHLLNIGKTKESLALNINIVNAFMQTNAQEECIGFLNFQVTCYTYLNQHDKAIQISDEAMSIAKKFNNKDEILSTLQFRGDSYYRRVDSPLYSKLIYEYWKGAYQIYKDEYTANTDAYPISRKISVVVKAIIAELILNNTLEANKLYLQVAGLLDNTDMVYYEIKIRLARCLILSFMENSSENRKEWSQMLTQAIDLCAIYGNITMYTDCFHLLAIFNIKYSQYALAVDNYKKALNIILVSLSSKEDFLRWRHFFLDMAVSCKKYREDIPDILLKNIPDNETRNLMTRIANLSEKDFQYYLEHSAQVTATYFKDEQLNLPKI